MSKSEAATGRMGDEKAVADALGVSVGWIRKDRRTDRIIPFYRLGRSIRYDISEAISAIKRNRFGGQS